MYVRTGRPVQTVKIINKRASAVPSVPLSARLDACSAEPGSQDALVRDSARCSREQRRFENGVVRPGLQDYDGGEVGRHRSGWSWRDMMTTK